MENFNTTRKTIIKNSVQSIIVLESSYHWPVLLFVFHLKYLSTSFNCQTFFGNFFQHSSNQHHQQHHYYHGSSGGGGGGGSGGSNGQRCQKVIKQMGSTIVSYTECHWWITKLILYCILCLG
mgnify:CR=1 FL=1